MTDRVTDSAEIQIAARIDASTVHKISGNAFIAVPDDYKIADLERFQAEPARTTTAYRFRDTASLAAYCNRFATTESIAFSQAKAAKIAVVIDHDGPGKARHRTHRATFEAAHSPQYLAWRKIDGKPMSQVEAGMFLEERAVDVAEPDAASIMDMVMQFDALKKVTFKQSTRLHDGQRQFTYSEENEARGAVTLPERIFIRVAVFEGQEPDRILIRVRYRIDDGALRFTFEIHDREEVERVAFERCEDAFQTALTAPMLMLRTHDGACT